MMKLVRVLTLVVSAFVATAQTAVPAFAQASAARAPVEYRLGAGDVVRISVYQNPDLALETRITDAGSISFPLLGSVRLGGLGIAQAEKAIADGLRSGNFVKQPQVTITVVDVRGNQASVLGQVNRPGRYPIESGEMRLTEMLAMAGGASPAGADFVVVTGVRNGQPFRQQIDLPSVFRAGGVVPDIPVLDGDVIWIERAPVIYIYGQVQRPGTVRLERDLTVLQALATSGGLTLRGTEKGIRVHRRDAQGRVQILEPAMDDKLLDGDVLFVRESLF